jgi:hypothetical protein
MLNAGGFWRVRAPSPVICRILKDLWSGSSVAVADTIAVGDSAELAAVDDDPLSTDQTARPSEPHKLHSSVRNRVAVHPAELSDGLVIGIKPFHVATALRLKTTR